MVRVFFFLCLLSGVYNAVAQIKTKPSPTKSVSVRQEVTPAPKQPKNVIGKSNKVENVYTDDFNKFPTNKKLHKIDELKWQIMPGLIITESSKDFKEINSLKNEIIETLSNLNKYNDTSHLAKPKNPFETTLEYNNRISIDDSLKKELFITKINSCQKKLAEFKNRYIRMVITKYHVRMDSTLYDADSAKWTLIIYDLNRKIEEYGVISIPVKSGIRVARGIDEVKINQLMNIVDSTTHYIEIVVLNEEKNIHYMLSRNITTNEIDVSGNQRMGLGVGKGPGSGGGSGKGTGGGNGSVMGSGNEPRVTQGNRKITNNPRFDGDMDNATIFARINVSPDGKGTFVEFAKGSTQMTNQYKQAVIQYLSKIKFDPSDKNDIVVVQFNFRVN